MPKQGKKGSIKKRSYVIDCSDPVEDDIFDMEAFVDFLNTRIKINGKTGVLGNDIVVSQDGTNQVKVTVRVEFSKRYLKYLTKKFLKAQKLRDYIHVIAKEKNSYFLKYYNFHQEEEEEEE